MTVEELAAYREAERVTGERRGREAAARVPEPAGVARVRAKLEDRMGRRRCIGPLAFQWGMWARGKIVVMAGI